MAFDPITLNPGVGGASLAFDTFTDTDAVVKTMPYGAVAFGALNGPYTAVTLTTGFPVQPQTGSTWAVTGPLTDAQLRAAAVPVSDGGGSLTVDAPASAPVYIQFSDGAVGLTAVPIEGKDFAGASVTGKPVLIGGYGSATAPAPANDPAMVRFWCDLQGRLQVGDGGGSLTIDAASLPLPAGAATAAAQATGNASLASLDTSAGRLAGKYLDFDTGAGTDSVVAIGLLLPAAGGAVAGGTSTNPIRTDPTGTTTQPVSAVSLPLPSGAATNTTLLTLLADATFTARVGEVQATPTANTVLGRLKDLLTGIVLAAGANVVGWVNLIAGQTGITGGAGAVAANTPRMTLASDDPAVASLNVMDDWDETDRCKVNPIVGQAGLEGGSGAATAKTVRTTLATDIALPTGTNSIGQVTANAGTNLNTSALATESGGNLAAAAASLSVLDDWDDGADRCRVVGAAAHDAAVSGNPVLGGGEARTTNPTAVSDGDAVRSMHDKLGRQIVVAGHVRDLVTDSGTITLTSTTETTLLAAVASTFLDLTLVLVINTSATAVRVDFRDDTAGTVRFPVYVPAGETRGFVPPRPIKQTAVNKNWTVQLSGAVTDVRVFAQADKNL